MFSFASPLYAITPDLADTRCLLEMLRTVLSSGVRLVQYRDKISPMAEKLQRARAINALCRAHEADLIINDDVVLAMEIGAAGVHLGATDGSIRDARRLMPPNTIIGASCYNDLALARQALQDGASYVAFGACFDSPTKPAARRVTLPELRAFRQALGPSVAICGIGGITRDNIASLSGAVDAVALISELFGSTGQPASPAAIRQCVHLFLGESALISTDT